MRRAILCVGLVMVVALAASAGSTVLPLGGASTGFSLADDESGGELLVVEVSEVQLDPIEIEGRQWAVVRVAGASNLMQRGRPSLPYLSTEYLLGSTDGVALQLVSLQTREVDLADLGFAGVAPSKGNFNRTVDPASVPWVFDPDVYGSDRSFPGVSSWVDGPFIAGPLRGQAIRVPVAQWRASTNLLQVVELARFRVVRQERADNPRTRPQPALTGLYDEIARTRAVNYDRVRPRYAPFVETGRLLILTPSGFLSQIQPLVDWETQVGYPTVVATVASGATASQVYTQVQTYYNQPERVTWIILVGDYQQIPDLNGVMEGAPCDPCYTKLEGNDNRPDAAISRLSAQNSGDLVTQVNKVLTYEQQPDGLGAWYSAGFGIGGDSFGEVGYYDWQRVEMLRTDLMVPNFTYTEFDQIYHDPGSAAAVTTAIDDGRSLGVYIGHGSPTSWGTTGFSTSNVHTLTNGNMLPIIWSVACNNGEFNDYDECFAESWLRRSGGGAVSFEGGTTSESWVPPCDGQRGVIDSLRLGTAFTTGGQHVNGKQYCMDVNGAGNNDEGTKWMEQSTLFGSCVMWPRTATPQQTREPDDFNLAGGVASLTVKLVGGAAYAKANGAIVSFYTLSGRAVQLLGSGLIDATGVVHATVSGDPTHCHIHGFNLVPAEYELAARPAGRVSLDHQTYSCTGVVGIRVVDSNVGPGGVSVTLGVPGTSITVPLTVGQPGFYSGTATLGTDLVVSHGQILTATYVDADDGQGGTNVERTATAAIDCQGPVISAVVSVATEDSLTITFTTSEPGTTVVQYGTTRPPAQTQSDATLATSHNAVLQGLDPCTTYYFSVASTDALGNTSVDTHGGVYYSAETMVWQVLFSEPFDTNPGWAINNNGNTHGWAFGQPTGGHGDHGSPDPTSGHTGTNVYGVNLAGGYDPNLTDNQLQLEAPAVDCSQATSVQVRFWRWLGVEQSIYDHARVQVSVDGGAWTTVWENADTIDDGSWVEQSVDLTGQAAHHASVKVRWTMGASDSAWQYCGWNLDDVSVAGAIPCADAGLIFADDFEGGSTAAWSNVVP